MPPGYIFRSVVKRLSVTWEDKRFRSPEEAMDALDAMLEKGVAVGCQTGIYWLPYFPSSMRFHFNAHNLIVFGREGDEYLISDPVFEQPVRCSREHLAQARFAFGPLAPRGRMYWIHQDNEVPASRLAVALREGLLHTCFIMNIPVGPIGVRGPRFLAWRIRKWFHRLPPRRIALVLGSIVRMQEEIGTDGAGLRFMFASCLQEAVKLLHIPDLEVLSREMMAIGDRWREFALHAVRAIKNPEEITRESLEAISELLVACSDAEYHFFRKLNETLKRSPQP